MKSNAPYKVEIAPSAERQLKKLPKNIQLLIIKELKKLKTNPRPKNIKKLAGITENFYRLKKKKGVKYHFVTSFYSQN